MRYVLDLFSGTGSATEAFRKSENWKVIDVELSDKFNPTIQADVAELDPGDFSRWDFELIWASPPCTTYSMASVSHYWKKENGKYVPRDEKAEKHLELVLHTLDLIEALNPDYWFMENPRAMLRKILFQERGIEPTGTVTYCQYGDDRMKPTDLWGDHPQRFPYWSCSNGDDCHESAPRGSKTGTQGLKNSETRAMVPEKISELILRAIEDEPIKAETRAQKTISGF